MRRVVVGVVVALAVLAAPASAAVETSPGVRLVGQIPERGIVSARAVGNLLYVSSLGGVTIFDISNPQAPARAGRVDLPNAQNEDVDAGSGILLVSDDPFGGRGILHIIDVRDPANPRPLSTFSTWAPGLLDGFTRGWRPPRRGGIGHTASCIQECRYAYLAGSPAGIDIVDLRDPANPRLAGRFAAREAAGRFGTHDVQVDRSGLAWIAGGGGTAAYDVSDPVRPRLVKRTNRRGSRGPWNNFIHHNTVRLSDGVLAVTEEDFGGRCRGAGTLQTWRIGRGRLMRPMDSFGVEVDGAARVMCSAHYFEASNGLIAQGFYEQGVRLVDARRPGRLRQVGYYINRPGMVWSAIFPPTDPTGSTVYALDHSRGIDVLALDRDRLRPVRRRGARRAIRNPRRGVGTFIVDGFERVRAGQRIGIGVGVFGPGRPVRVTVTLPPQLIDLNLPDGADYDPATRTLRFTLRSRRTFRSRALFARVAPGTPVGTRLEVIGYASGPRDLLPLDDRGVDVSFVGERAVPSFDDDTATAASLRAASRAGPPTGFCRLPAGDYTL
jgi:LVIVD repeat-containing protein